MTFTITSSFKWIKRFCGYAFVYLIMIYVFTSCTVLQWRQSDTEIKEKFDSLQIPTRISYFSMDSLDLKIRTQHIERSDTDIDLLFFHGSPSSLSAWNGYLTDSLLATKANLHAVDRPGYGYSNFGDEMTSIELQAEVMSTLIDAHNLQNVIAIGSSYGGPLVAQLAVINPKVKAVVMISPAIDPLQEKKIWASRLTQWWLTRWLSPTGYRVAGDEKTVHAKELALLDDNWQKLTIPVLHIHGNVDDIVPYTNVDYTAKKFKNIEIITIPDTGHEIAWYRPELIKPHILALIEQIADTTATRK